MAVTIQIPIYRFFDRKEYVESMVKNGEMFFNVISEFQKLENDNFRDPFEKTLQFKNVVEKTHSFGRSMEIGIKTREISEAWAFCGTSSAISSARKQYCVWIKNFGYLIHQIDEEVKKKFGEELLVMFGPITYYSSELEKFSKVQMTPFFTKPTSFKNDFEFRIVIAPTSNQLDKGQIEPIKIYIPNPSLFFEEIILID